MILDGLSNPTDIKKLSLAELNDLCLELREEIIRVTSKNGGHLGSNLGAVEIIVAAHYVFNIEKDKFVFDVGHQAYAHKFLTGRKELMENLRSKGGASGFPDPAESKYDHFIAGHASTSLSAALGISKARDLKGENFKIISILGDGSLSGGMIYEAMNNLAGAGNFIVILNDNQMSISESVGSMRRYLSKLLAMRGSLAFRRRFSSMLSIFSPKTARKIEFFIKSIISAFRGGNIFEEFGFQYLGPIGGHDIKDLINVFRNVRDVANYKPVIIHVVTQKGKGFPVAEADLTKLHGIDNTEKNKFSDVFGRKIVQLAEEDEKIVCITAAMKDGTGLSLFAEKFPKRFFDVGIAEEHAVTFSAGLAIMGLKPFVCIYSTFLQRGFDQIYHDVVLQNLPVRFIIDKAGFPGTDGKTHAGLYDLSMLQNFPNFTIMSPSSKNELERMLEFALENNSNPTAIRFPKAEAICNRLNYEPFQKSQIVLRGSQTLIISTGCLLDLILQAVDISKTTPTVIDARFIAPFDFVTFYEQAEIHEKILIFEEGVFGGISNIILDKLLKEKRTEIISKIQFVNAEKTPVKHLPRAVQLEEQSFDLKKLIKLIS
ncbi:MAG: 1-deoxy-D-xylulose-5-phosphate synthase [Holosporales bacterium]|jgi:1-deoxy-D-xylulose-5-phosphate synthase|nr:1-deoxy-D-xylulose-5-phosphate synthase [Holosporales bacterium]